VEAEDAAGNVSPPSNQAGATVTGANTAPTPAIAAPSAQTTWKVDDAISFSGSAVDAQDGTLPAAALTWTLILHDCSSACQTRVVQTSTGVATGSAPAPDAAYPSYLELQLAATDSAGLTGTTSVRLDPQTVTLTFASSPSGLQLVLGSSGAAAPYSRTVVVRSSNTVSATSPQTLNGTTYTFSSWSDGGAQAHT